MTVTDSEEDEEVAEYKKGKGGKKKKKKKKKKEKVSSSLCLLPSVGKPQKIREIKFQSNVEIKKKQLARRGEERG